MIGTFRKWLIGLLLLALTGWGVYAFIFQWIVSKSAALTLPRKWKTIPLREPLSTAHAYFGQPSHRSRGMEEWTNGLGNKKYYLRLYYSGVDTVISSYSIYYSYKNWLLSKDYLMDSVSIR